MKQKISDSIALVVGLAIAISLAASPVSLLAASAFAGQKQNSQDAISAKHKGAIAEFEKRVKEYVKLREGLEEKMPKLSKESTPEQIEAHKKAFQEAVRSARVGAKHGDLFSPEIADYIRATIKNEFKGRERKELRETVLVEADTKAVPLRVNYPYPETAELLEMPPTLLLKLPQLPKQVKYRFVGRNMLLVDRENGLIIDYMLDALP
jgi:hypothetical protein